MKVTSFRAFPFKDESKYPLKADSSRLTFAGVLAKYYYYDKDRVTRGISKRWIAVSTYELYEGIYNRILLPYLPKFTALDDYTEETVRNVFEQIVYEEDPSTEYLIRIRRLFRLVYDAGLRNGNVKEDVLWGTAFGKDASIESEDSLRRSILLKKSFSAEEEVFILAYLMKGARRMAGSRLGVRLMFEGGLRNGEAAGLNYEHARQFLFAPELHRLQCVQTTIPGTNRIQSGGKTNSAPRNMPISTETYELIRWRAEKWQERDDHKNSIEQMPIVARSQKGMRCSAEDINREAKKCFESIRNISERLGVLDDMLFKQRFEIAGVLEKDPTAYAFRRNAATEMHAVGLSEQEIQYCIGHVIDDTYLERRDFTNEDMLIPIAKKLSFRPIVQAMKRFKSFSLSALLHKSSYQLDSGQHKVDFSNEEYVEILIPAAENEIEVFLDLTALEPQDFIEISMTTTQGESILEVYKSQQKPDYANRSVNCRSVYNEVYNKYLNKYQKQLFQQTRKHKRLGSQK